MIGYWATRTQCFIMLVPFSPLAVAPFWSFDSSLHYLPTYLNIYVPTFLPTNLPIYLPTYLAIYLSTYLFTYVRTYLSIYLPIYVPTYLGTFDMQNIWEDNETIINRITIHCAASISAIKNEVEWKDWELS